MKKIPSTLAIDRWSKYLGVAYVLEWQQIPMPVGYLLNDQMLYFSLADIVARHYVTRIVVWFPQRQKNIQAKIQEFVEKLRYVIHPDIEIEFVDEDYSSVQSGEIFSNFQKKVAEDTVSAMVILERRLALQK